MTKKAEKAAAVLKNRQDAFLSKIKRLIGHVSYIGAKLNAEFLLAQFAAGKTAEVVAAEIAGREPVGKVVHPLKVQAVTSANKYANEEIARVMKKLEEANWDVLLVAPFPGRELHGFARAAAYHYYEHVSRLTTWRTGSRSGADKGPLYVDMNREGCTRYVEECEKRAAEEYDLFIIKLVVKVGEVKKATLEGSHVWDHSILTVTKAGGLVENWKTQQIANQSKFGKYFPQWPTRLMKGK